MRHRSGKELGFVEGEALPRFRIVVNGRWEPGGFATFEAAIQEIQGRLNRLAKRYHITQSRHYRASRGNHSTVPVALREAPNDSTPCDSAPYSV